MALTIAERSAKYRRAHLAERAAYQRSPMGRYIVHRANSARRRIPFLLTFEQWWALWAPHWESKRGKVMARTGDRGAYEAGNVRIATRADNARETWSHLPNACFCGKPYLARGMCGTHYYQWKYGKKVFE